MWSPIRPRSLTTSTAAALFKGVGYLLKEARCRCGLFFGRVFEGSVLLLGFEVLDFRISAWNAYFDALRAIREQARSHIFCTVPWLDAPGCQPLHNDLNGLSPREEPQPVIPSAPEHRAVASNC